MIEKRRLAVRRVSIALALAALCFDARTFGPTARANQSPPLFIVVTGGSPCDPSSLQTVTVAQVSNYSVNNGVFCFDISTILPDETITSISSPYVDLDPGSIPANGGTICGSTPNDSKAAQFLAESLVVTFEFHTPCVIRCVNDVGSRSTHTRL